MSCNDDIEWYKSVKETQGSVETTSYGQMSNIIKYGTYRVGFKKNAQTVHDLISVTLSRRCQKVVKWKYSLDELRDLESKLVLICGNKAENRAEVDHYLNVSKYLCLACTVTNVLADKFKCECCLYPPLMYVFIYPTYLLQRWPLIHVATVAVVNGNCKMHCLPELSEYAGFFALSLYCQGRIKEERVCNSLSSTRS